MDRSRLCSRLLVFVALLALSVGCRPADQHAADSATATPSVAVDPYGSARPGPTPRPTSYLAQVSFKPEQAQYMGQIEQAFELTAPEQALLAQNGFVVSDRIAFEDFTSAYGYIYWKDLPVLITTDSLLQALHQGYDDILIQLEGGFFRPRLASLLQTALKQIQADAAANTDKALSPLYRDLETYLTVTLALLTGSPQHGTPGSDGYAGLATAATQVGTVKLFGGEPRSVDFTLFAPRGHYLGYPEREQYFRAMMWLAQIDFRFVTYDPTGSGAHLQPEHVAAALLLHDAFGRANLREPWAQLDAALEYLVGRSDNMRLADLDVLLADAGLATPADALSKAGSKKVLDLLTTKDYGLQRITGQLLARSVSNPSPKAIARPVSFALLGQRFVLDSYLMSNLVYDRLWVDGQPVQRPLPSPLDVAYVLGNDRAFQHLGPELERYGYQDNLTTLRAVVDEYEPGFWSGTAYNRWLDILRTLNTSTTGAAYPQAMRTAAWADKATQTQLASWAQLRRDTILYVKQSVTVMAVCEYPDGYVEPYPEFFAALADYARAGHALFDQLGGSSGTQSYAELLAYFDRLEEAASRLREMAEKELRLEPFTEQEIQFLKSTVVQQDDLDVGCDGTAPYRERWDGWYPQLFLYEDKSPALIADIHTNPNNDPAFPELYPPRVLHVATGPVAAMVLIVNTDEGQIAYAGPAFTYYEVTEEGYPPVRLNDADWQRRLRTETYPRPPQWTSSFRLPASSSPHLLEMPVR